MSNVRLDLLRLNGLGQVAAEIEQLQDQNSSLLATNYDLRKERDRMTDELTETRRDAQRYRWLVSQGDPILWDYLGGMDDDQIDEAIDKWIAEDAATKEQP